MNPNESKLPSDSLIKRYAHILYGVVHGGPGTDALKYYDAINPAEKEGWERLARANLAGFPNLDEALDAWLEDQIAQRSATVQSFTPSDDDSLAFKVAAKMYPSGASPTQLARISTTLAHAAKISPSPTVQAKDDLSVTLSDGKVWVVATGEIIGVFADPHEAQAVAQRHGGDVIDADIGVEPEIDPKIEARQQHDWGC